MTKKHRTEAVIYIRVSDQKQVERGDGLRSQERTCRDFAERKGYEVVQVFEDVLTGERADRPGIRAMKAYLRKHRGTVIVVDHANRLGRDLLGYLLLRADLEALGAILESPVMDFKGDSSSRLVENVVASVSQYQREANAEQTKNRMQARVLNGRWPFQAPVGYRYERLAGSGKVLVRDEPVASIVQEALESFASGHLETQAEVVRFLQNHPLFPKYKTGVVLHTRVTVMLSQCLYAGYIEMPSWNIPMFRAQHEPLISFETFQTIKKRLEGGVYTKRQPNINEDFPLRGYVECADCGRPLTACWSKGTHAKHPYYLCPQRGCESYGKSIRRAVLESEVEEVLKALTPSETLFNVVTAVFKDLWDRRLSQTEDQTKALAGELKKADQQIAQTLERILDSSLPTVIAAYESRIRRLEEQKLLIQDRIEKARRPKRDYQKSLRTALTFLSNPWNLWISGQLADRQTALKLAFVGRLQYSRKNGLRTANLALPFKLLTMVSDCSEKMVHPKRFELLPPRFVVYKAAISARASRLDLSWYKPDDMGQTALLICTRAEFVRTSTRLGALPTDQIANASLEARHFPGDDITRGPRDYSFRLR